jgi:hypothetical protein
MYRYKLGQSLFEGDKMEPAKKEFDKALSINKRLFKAHWYNGRILENWASSRRPRPPGARPPS